ncbi:efflux RND transporter periplasmic adaptor subunit [bacterium]|nr:efflux RND transporter periplasmic adaptor subunit [bacterium]
MLNYKKLFRQLLLISLIVIGTTFSSCTTKESRSESVKKQSMEEVEIFVATPTSVINEIYTTGTILADEQVDIKAPISGRIMSINFKEGQSVSKGQLLLKIDDRDWKAQLSALEVKLTKAQKDLERKKELYKINGASMQEVEDLQSTVAELQSQIEQMNVNVDYANIRAPFSGKIGLRNLSTGAYVSAGQYITTLVKTNPIKIDFQVPATYIGQIKEGQAVQAISKSTNDTIYAKIYAFDPGISTSSRNMNARAIADNSHNKFVPGDFLEVRVILGRIDNAIMVPSESVIPDLDKQIVYLYRNGKVDVATIETGLRTDSTIYIIKGIKKGDSIITSGILQIRPGMNVKVRNVL